LREKTTQWAAVLSRTLITMNAEHYHESDADATNRKTLDSNIENLNADTGNEVLVDSWNTIHIEQQKQHEKTDNNGKSECERESSRNGMENTRTVEDYGNKIVEYDQTPMTNKVHDHISPTITNPVYDQTPMDIGKEEEIPSLDNQETQYIDTFMAEPDNVESEMIQKEAANTERIDEIEGNPVYDQTPQMLMHQQSHPFTCTSSTQIEKELVEKQKCQEKAIGKNSEFPSFDLISQLTPVEHNERTNNPHEREDIVDQINGKEAEVDVSKLINENPILSVELEKTPTDVARSTYEPSGSEKKDKIEKEDEKAKNEREQRRKKAASRLCSPYMNRVVSLEEKRTDLEYLMSNYIFSASGHHWYESFL